MRRNRKIYNFSIARDRLLKILGAVKTLCSFLFLYLICFAPEAHAQEIGLPLDSGLPYTRLNVILENLVRWVLAVFGFLAILSFLISGILYLTAGGDEKAADSAKRQMKWSIIGVIVGLIGLVIILAIDSLMRGGAP